MKTKPDGRKLHISTAKVGPKGQIVIPKEVRDIFRIQPGDQVMILADSKRGIAITRSNVFSKIAEKIFSGEKTGLEPEPDEEDAAEFANAIQNALEESEDD